MKRRFCSLSHFGLFCYPRWFLWPFFYQIHHQLHDTLPCHVRLFTVPLNGRVDDLPNAFRFALWLTFCRKQTDFGVGTSPVTHANKPRWRYFISLDPNKSATLVVELPRFYHFKCFGQIWHCRPQKKRTIRISKFTDWKCANIFCFHERIMPTRSAVSSATIFPRRIGINNVVFVDMRSSYLFSFAWFGVVGTGFEALCFAACFAPFLIC